MMVVAKETKYSCAYCFYCMVFNTGRKGEVFCMYYPPVVDNDGVSMHPEVSPDGYCSKLTPETGAPTPVRRR